MTCFKSLKLSIWQIVPGLLDLTLKCIYWYGNWLDRPLTDLLDLQNYVWDPNILIYEVFVDRGEIFLILLLLIFLTLLS